jgi:hypothetical protein
MFSSPLGLLCAVFIAADYFGYRELGWGWLLLCWIMVFLDSVKQDIGVTIKEKEQPHG